MSDLEDCTGSWAGYWEQRGERGNMKIALLFASRRIEGEGIDRIGSFKILGTYSLAGYAVQFIKSYPTHEILYEGIWNGQKLTGTWVQQGGRKGMLGRWAGHTGPFELWPDPSV